MQIGKRYLNWSPVLLSFTAVTFACVCSRERPKPDDQALRLAAEAFVLDAGQAQADLAELTQAPHPLGTPRQQAVAAYLTGRLNSFGAKTVSEPFTAVTPNPAAMSSTGPVATTLDLAGANLYARKTLVDAAPCVVALASHFDTKVVEGMAYVGANDSGSSTAVLVQQVNFLRTNKTAKENAVCDVVAIFFDGEEAVLEGWTDGQTRHPAKIQDNTYGSRHAASRLTACKYEGHDTKCLPADLGGQPLIALVLMDMIGSPNLALSRDQASTPKLITLATAGAAALATKPVFKGPSQVIEDDHVPYLAAKVPALDLIDFNHIAYWHASGDSVENLSNESMQLAGRIALYTALAVARSPKVFLETSEK